MINKEKSGLQPAGISTINDIGGNVDKVFGGEGRHIFFEMLSYSGFERWIKDHEGDYRYAGLIDSMLFIDSVTVTYRGAWSIYWSSADAAGAIRVLQGVESTQYEGVA